ncbi:hypothetical protein AB205_0214740 [Aquarana catesbeiana]|uniref:Uncharacterized protein n=1 Tax=Aquarana catesbeiana TaxID=8400 RepID=A0A2G9QGU5_AQUCT|nr:hypothetical protein AB205_0214740 [Aquarana catesbeiana]
MSQPPPSPMNTGSGNPIRSSTSRPDSATPSDPTTPFHQILQPHKIHHPLLHLDPATPPGPAHPLFLNPVHPSQSHQILHLHQIQQHHHQILHTLLNPATPPPFRSCNPS